MTYSALANPSKTRSILDAFGLATKKSLGQHFLIDDNIVGNILALADIGPDDVVLEVGPGIGTLTVALLERAKAVLAVERDRDLLEALAATTSEHPSKLAVIQADATSVSTAELKAPFGALPTTFVANLPYEVAATLILRFFQELPTLTSATIMVQSEVADRICAQPGTKSYGAYTVKLRMLASPVGRFQVSRTSFLPPPRVDSAVIRLEARPLSADFELIMLASRVAEAAFAQRRKTIRNSMRATLDVEVEALDEAFARVGIDPTSRGETLEPSAFLELAKALFKE